jgi:hypothetical protein
MGKCEVIFQEKVFLFFKVFAFCVSRLAALRGLKVVICIRTLIGRLHKCHYHIHSQWLIKSLS